MANLLRLLAISVVLISMMLLGGCSGSGGHSSTHVYSQGYNDPYSNWGRRTVYVDRDHDHNHRPKPPSVRPPSRPPGAKPPAMGRPPQRPTKPMQRPRPTPRGRR